MLHPADKGGGDETDLFIFGSPALETRPGPATKLSE